MKILWCWRCKMEVGMLDKEEYLNAFKLYMEGAKGGVGLEAEKKFRKLLDYYLEVTGFKCTVPNAIMHHRIDNYGPPCENCGKPYRTPRASFCAACGYNRTNQIK